MPPRNQVALNCEVCDKLFSVPASAAVTRRFCSRACHGKWRSATLIGPNSTSWKEGSRVERTCEVCGKSFETRAYAVAKGAGRFCSRSCKSRGIRPAQPRAIRVCETCGKQFEAIPADVARGKARFCSPGCRPQTRPTKQVQRQCEVCGTDFITQQRSIDKGHGRFCSLACWGKQRDDLPPEQQPAWKGGDAVRHCAVCGGAFAVRGTRRRSYALCCSQTCHGKWKSTHLVGANSPAWQGGKSFEPYPPVFNKQFKRVIRDRDHHKCALCGVSDSRAVHHINYVKYDTVPENCITLCGSCHGKTNSRRAFWQAVCTEIMTLRSWGLAPHVANTV